MRLGLDVSAVPNRVAGAGRYIVELARRLPEDGTEVTLAARRGDGERWRSWSSARVRDLVPARRPLRLAYEAALLGRTPLLRGLDVWHGPHYTMPRGAPIPVVVTIHDLTLFTHPQYHERAKVRFFQHAIAYAARHAAVLIAVSDWTAARLDEVVGEHAPVVVAPHGVDLDRFSPQGDDEAAWAASPLDRRRPYVLFVGTLEPRKGVDVLLAAFAEVGRADPDLELWLVGQRGWHADVLEAAVASHPLRERIVRLGYVADDLLPALLRGARAVAYPSRAEGFGLPVLEALACGAPVATTAGTVMAEVAGSAAFLSPVGDAGALATSLEHLTRLEGAERARVAARAVAQAQTYTWDRSLRAHRRAYQMAEARGA
ncbi:MAG: glycosyltransferase family 4 protein [Acidimicrobiales bacterium]